VLTLGSNPQRAGAYGPLISAYINTINRLANTKGRVPFSEILEECSTITVHTIDKTLATGRSNLMAITLCFQNASQIRLAYGKEFADVILNSCGNIICGQASGETARLVAERFGKTMQERESFTISASDTSINQSQHLEYSIPPSRISSLSSGEFVGMVADTPKQPIELKTFCCRIVNDPVALAEEQKRYQELPIIRDVSQDMLMDNFHRIREDIAQLIDSEITRISNNPLLRHLLIE
jgi:hypothetical protein